MWASSLSPDAGRGWKRKHRQLNIERKAQGKEYIYWEGKKDYEN